MLEDLPHGIGNRRSDAWTPRGQESVWEAVGAAGIQAGALWVLAGWSPPAGDSSF